MAAPFDPNLPLAGRPPLWRVALAMAWIDLRRRSAVPLVVAGAIAICCVLLLVVSDLSLGLFAYQERTLQAALPTRIVALADVADPIQRLTPQRLATLARLEGVAQVVPRYERRALVQLGSGPPRELPVDGTLADDPDHAAARMAWGRGLAADDEFAVVLPRSLFDQLGGRLGALVDDTAPPMLQVVWTRTGRDGLEESVRAVLPIVGVSATAELPYARIRVPMALAQRLDPWTRGLDADLGDTLVATPQRWRRGGAEPAEMNVHAATIDDVEPIASELRRRGFEVRSRAADVRALRDSATALTRFVGTLLIPVIGMAALLILALQGIALAARRDEAWLLRSLGVPAHRITFGLHGVQGFLVGAAAFAAAMLAFVAIGPLFREVLAAALSVPDDAREPGLRLPAWLVATCFGLSIGLATLGSIAPSAWMLRSLRTRAWKAAA